ncbi:unnamed protein product [Adineta steineri]|uniref:Uncharacterized protein n=1 Tax=Adineta steineri TaxID=433720 RepID=A0A816CTN9_9BILA|nr:unnamed protein product [Adineta steineri]CAF1626018.1 unnamed protein product [Adineta steineri]
MFFLSSFFQEYIVEEYQQPQELLMQLYQQAESMRVMNNTTNYDCSQVKSKMNTTYSHRQQLVREMKFIKDIVELYSALSITNLEVIDVHPKIQVQSIDKIKDYAVIIEYNRLISTNSQVETVAALIGSYEIFNIEYPLKVRATLEVLNGLSFAAK